MNNKLKTYVVLFLNLFLTLVTLTLSIVGFAWFSMNKEIKSDDQGITTNFPPRAEYNKLYYNFEEERVERTNDTTLELPAYDSIFVEDNENLAVILEIKLTGIHSELSSVSVTFSRERTQEETLNELDQYSSSILQIGYAIATSNQSTDELTYSWALTNKIGNYVFTTKTNNQYRKVPAISFSHTLTSAEKTSNTLYLYLIVDYSASLVADYITHYGLFDTTTGTIIEEISIFENDIDALEVNVQ